MTKRIKIFTAIWCASCQGLKVSLQYYSRYIEYMDVDTEDGRLEASMNKVRFIPFILIDGKEASITELYEFLNRGGD